MGKAETNKLRVQLKLAKSRMSILQNKRKQANDVARREIGTLLEQGKEESARIRVEHIIREDFNIEAMEILELYCDLLLARLPLLEQMKHCDISLSECVNSLIYAAPRIEIPEMLKIRDLLIMKFGKEFGRSAMENKNDVVNSRIIHKLSISAPDPFLVNQYLQTIAKIFEVDWEPEEAEEVKNTFEQQVFVPPQNLVPARETKAEPASDSTGESHLPKDSKEEKRFDDRFEDNVDAKVNEDDDLPDFDDLARRFEKLRQR